MVSCDARYFVAATVPLMAATIAYGFYMVFHGLVTYEDVATYTNTRRLFIQIHTVVVSVASISLLLQLVPHLRTTCARFHRVNGRVCICSFLIAMAVGAMALSYDFGSGKVVLGFIQSVALTSLVAGTALPAWYYARAGDFVQHRRFAIRLAGVTLSALIVFHVSLVVVLALEGWHVLEVFHSDWSAFIGSIATLFVIFLVEWKLQCEQQDAYVRWMDSWHCLRLWKSHTTVYDPIEEAIASTPSTPQHRFNELAQDQATVVKV
ncbi:Aste57867_16036 [Aphanomyces stellatus]|uniref:Aste57867_16036 protein n=1 Tax=Aphanomyces stellatus TaxID=120398 RepID=A0A485L6E5_9STRA|nr:hypothetical protein As57867_015980 [Aphanomyces stellatus]VFT92820.1 Aste57867_16036 [Aphanomyces stellatus]